MLLERLSRPVRGVRIITRGDGPVGAQVIPQRRLDAAEVQRLVDHLAPRVDGPIVTTALTPVEQQGFLESGFVERESLHLLRHSLDRVPEHERSARLRAGRRGDLGTVLEIDRASFDEFWTLDREGLQSARRATPVHRYRVATIDRRVVGYAITGRAGRATFLQRLGVAPDVRGRGLGAHLVADAIEWAIAERGLSMLVNTQEINTNALRLYQRLGFRLGDERLTVLEWPR